MPALFTRVSTRPNRATAASTMLAPTPGSPMSPGTANTMGSVLSAMFRELATTA